MNYLKQYRIPFSGLAAGNHDFEFEIGDKFFDCYEHSLVKKGNLNAQVSLQKQETMLIVTFHIQGTIQLTCDVCLNDFDSPTDFEERVIVKFVQEEWVDDSEDDDVIVLKKTDYELDIATLLYDYINVRVPYYTKCSEQGLNITCDPEMLARISNEEQQSSEITEETIDPRWAALMNIKNN